MRLIRINFFEPCTNYTKRKLKTQAKKVADSSADSVKTIREKILAYTEAREFSLFRSFASNSRELG